MILFGDEVSFAQWGSLSRTWAPKGKQPVVKTCGIRKGLKMFGAIEFKNGDFQYMECDGKFNGESYHRSKIVRIFTDKMKYLNRLFVYRLPSYSPDKNPIEKLWKNIKRDATHLKYFPTFESLRTSVINAFKKYLENARLVISVMKKMRSKAGLF